MHYTCIVIGDNPEKQLNKHRYKEWDWYLLGGRWLGFFKLKKGAKGTIGEHYDIPRPAPDRADSALLKDIDWDWDENVPCCFVYEGEFFHGLFDLSCY